MTSQAPKILWRRLPTFFPNIKLTLYPLSDDQRTQLLSTGYLEKAVFKTTPDVSKLEIREFLETVYQLPVVRVDTAVYEGKVRRMGKKRNILAQKSDYKKVWVQFAPGGILGPKSGSPAAAWRNEISK